MASASLLVACNVIVVVGVLTLAPCITANVYFPEYDNSYNNRNNNNSYFNNNNNNNNNSSINSTTDRSYHSSMLCKDITPQRSIDLHQIMGMWYGVEIIVHHQDVPGIYEYNSCVELRLSDITDQMPVNYRYHQQYQQQYQQRQRQSPYYVGHSNDDMYASSASLASTASSGSSASSLYPMPAYFPEGQTRFLRLIWIENADKNVEYVFRYNDQQLGYWINVGEQRGTMVVPHQFTQFTGTVQVLKAVNDHLVLTFCGDNMKSNIYTVVLSRTKRGLDNDTLRSIRGMLSKRGLSTDSIRKVCNSGAASVGGSIFLLIILSIFGVKRIYI